MGSDGKYCPGCRETLPLESFGKHKSKKDGLQSYCKACRSKDAKGKYKDKISSYQRRYNEDNREYLSEQAKKRYKDNPEPQKTRANAWRKDNPERKRALDKAWREANRERDLENSRNWARKNPEARAAIVRRYEQSHPEVGRMSTTRRRVRLKGSLCIKYTAEQLSGKLVVWRFSCYLCKESLGDDIEWDHVKPIVAGGPDILANLRPVHRICNRKKSGKWPI